MKTKKTLVIILFLSWSFMNVMAQEKRFFMPSEIAKAYEKGSRSYDGKPGKNYWQNFVDYKIKVGIKPSERLIDGYEKAVFKNSSPNSINSLVVRLYADVFKKGNSRGSSVDERDIDNGVELSDLKIDGQIIDLKNTQLIRRSGTNLNITLAKPLGSGKELIFETAWKQKIPYSNIRNGFIDSTTFFIGDWYPQIAVYDDVFGWDRLDYTLQTEFYNNLGKFDVEITVPNDFLIWATGTLVNSEQVLPKEINDKYIKAKSSIDVIHVFTKEDYDKGFKTLSNTWHYSANEVSDFAFGLSNHYLWDAGMQLVEDRQVLIQSAYPINLAKDCDSLIQIQQKTMKHFSEDVPGIPYPYESFTTFIGTEQGGMEYPMMANNGYADRGVTVHEMMHTYFPMYVRTNERRWAWMDEGWADFNTSVVEKRFFNNDKDFEKLFSGSSSGMLGMVGTNGDLPLIVSSEYMEDNYFYASYALPSFVYTIIHHHLGDELFFKCYKEYIKRWAKKSPTPYDFFYTFENVSGQDLSWIWKPWFFEFGYPDLAIQSFIKDKLIVNKIGNKPVPIFLDIEYENGDSKKMNKSAGVWADGKKSFEFKIADYQKIKRISLNKKIVDFNLSDNFYPSIKDLIGKANISDKIIGNYQPDQFPSVINIVKEDGLIYLIVNDFNLKMLIYPIDKFKFNSLDDSKKLEFIIDEKGEATSINIDWNGYKFKADRVIDI